MSTCPKCDSTLKPGTNFCGKCGNQNETTPMDPPEETTAELKTREEGHGAGAPRQLRTKDLTTRASASRVEPHSKAAGDETTDTKPPVEAPPEIRAPRRRWHVALLAAVVPALVVTAAAVYVLGRQGTNEQCKEERAIIANLTANNERLTAVVEEATENNRKLNASNEKAAAANEKAAAAIEKATAVIDRATANNEKLNINNQRLAATVEKVSAAKDKLAGELAAARSANAARDSARNGNKGRSSTGRAVYSRVSNPRDNGNDRRKKSERQAPSAGRKRRGTYSAHNGSGGAGGRYLSRN